jgi:Tol biopolymer transport system component
MKPTDSAIGVFASLLGLSAMAALAAGQDATTRASVSTSGQQGKTQSWLGGLSATGRHVVFYSAAGSLVAGDTNHVGDVFARDRDPDGNGIFDEGNDVTTRLSVDSAGAQGNDWSMRCSISADGRHVAYDSLAGNLVPNDTNGVYDVFTCDRDPDGNGIFDEGNDVTHRISFGPGGVQGDDASDSPSISADGRYVAFESLADNLVTGDTNGVYDVFVHDRDPDGNGIFDEGNGVTIRMSISGTGLEADGECHNPRISANGRHVGFDSAARNLVANDTNGVPDVFVHDRDPDGNGIFDEGNGDTLRVSVDSAGVEGDLVSHKPALSGDGRYVLFHSLADNLVGNDFNNAIDVFVRDRDPDANGIFDEGNAVTHRLSVDSSGVEGNTTSYAGAISDSGRYVTFYGNSSNLVAFDTNGESDVFLHDRDPDANGICDEGNGITTRASVDSCGFEGDHGSSKSEISADGRQVAYVSEASDLVASDTNQVGDIFVSDRALLPPGASWNNYGAGFPGTLGIPTLTASANPVFGTTIDVAIGNSLGAPTVGLVLVGTAQASIPTKQGGTILVAASLLFPLPIAAGGDTLATSIPNDPALCGVSAFLQTVEFDAGAASGFSFTPGLELALGH